MPQEDTNIDRQMYQMQKKGFEDIAKKIGEIKIDAPVVNVNTDSVASEVKKISDTLEKLSNKKETWSIKLILE